MKQSYKKRLLQQLLRATAALTIASLSQSVLLTDHLVTVAQETEQTQASSSETVRIDTTSQTQVRSTTGQDDIFALSDRTVYTSERTSWTETIDLGDKVAANMIWTLDGKPLEEWKTWDLQKGDFLGSPFITVEGVQTDSNYSVTVNLEALFGEDLSLRTPSNIRRTYRQYIGDFVLQGVSEDGTVVIEKTLTFRPYASFRTHEEMLAEIEQTAQQAAGNRLVYIDVIGTSAQNREIKMAVVAKDQASIDTYLNDTTPLMLTQPDEMLKLLEEGNFDYKLPILINNTHADEQPGIDIITSLFKEFAQKDVISFETTDATGTPIVKEIPVSALLDRFIFLFNFTENPDGDELNLRSLVNGLDPNRDAGFQANPETQAIVKQIHKWNPISILDIHGFVKEFLIEPATPPHDPNFEYDLIEDMMLENAREMGRAGVANSKYTSYIIPKIDWGDGWDDSFSGYTAVYGMYHGILGHTIEIPEANEESFKAGFFATLGSISYLTTRPDELMKRRLTYYSRGVNKVEDPKAEKPLVGPDGQVVGRRKNDQPKFFPDYYVIPMSLDKENDLGEAFKMIEYFTRNGVHVSQLIQDVGDFKKGDLVVDMAQAKRGFANHVLYSGSDESAWNGMYAELVVNFPDMKGFKAYAIFDENYFNGQLGEVTWAKAPRQEQVQTQVLYHFVANNSLSAVQAVNKAIRQGKEVYLAEDGFIMDTATFTALLEESPLHGEPLENKRPVGQPLKALKVYAPSHSYRWAGDFLIRANAALALEQMGFDVVETPVDADVIVLESAKFDASIFGQKPVLVLGGPAMQQLEKLGILPGFDAQQFRKGGDHEGLMRAVVDDKDPLTSGYAASDLFYSNTGNWIEGVPADFRTLVKIADENFYISGWWPNHDQLAGKPVAIAGTLQGQPLTIYAGNPANRLHPVRFFRWISNSVFGTKLAQLETIPESNHNGGGTNQTPPTSTSISSIFSSSSSTSSSTQPSSFTINQPSTSTSQPSQTHPSDALSDSASVFSSQATVKPRNILPKTGEESSYGLMIGGLVLLMGMVAVEQKKKG